MPDGMQRIDPDVVAGRIAGLLAERRSGAVKPLLAALEKLAPDHEDLLELTVCHCSQLGDFARALRLLDAAILRAPSASRYLQRGEIRFGQGDAAGAAADAAEAVIAAPALTRAKSLLGLAMLRLGRLAAALRCLDESFAADPAAIDVALALAALAPERAEAILRQAIAALPRLIVPRNALVRHFLCLGQLTAAAQTAQAARAEGVADAQTHCLLAFAEIEQRRWTDAASSVTESLRIAPGDPWAARLAAALAARSAKKGESPPPLLAAPDTPSAGDPSVFSRISAGLLREEPCEGPILDLFRGSGSEFPEGETYAAILLNDALGLNASPENFLARLPSRLRRGGIALAAIPTGNGLNGHGLFAHDEAQITAAAQACGLDVAFVHSGILRRIEGIPLHGVIARFRLC